jgi:hypothetical protein
MVELLLEIVLTVILEVVLQLFFLGPGQLLLVLFKQRRFGDDPDFTAFCLSVAFWLTLGAGIGLLVTLV